MTFLLKSIAEHIEFNVLLDSNLVIMWLNEFKVVLSSDLHIYYIG